MPSLRRRLNRRRGLRGLGCRHGLRDLPLVEHLLGLEPGDVREPVSAHRRKLLSAGDRGAPQLAELSTPLCLAAQDRGDLDASGLGLVEHTARRVGRAMEAVHAVDRVLDRPGAEEDSEHVRLIGDIQRPYLLCEPLLGLYERASGGLELPSRGGTLSFEPV